MKIEVFYVSGCPNYQPAVERIQKVLASESLRADIEGIPVGNEVQAKAFGFLGSPTVRVNGTDVEPNVTNAVGLTCRLYGNSGGVPSEEMLRMALVKANRGDGL
jgi:hypothetical protein